MDFLAWVAESVADWFSSWFKKDARILFLGLDNAGKVRQQVGVRGESGINTTRAKEIRRRV